MNTRLSIVLSLVALSTLHAETAKLTPNVIIILADDLGYGDVSCNGQGKIQTPAIDKLAAEGLRFTDGYAPSSTCTPTRYSLMTGEYAWRKKGTGILPGDAKLIISPSRVTLPRIFKDANYATAAIGKWHLGLGAGKDELDWNKPIAPGLNELGFDYSFHMAATGDRVPSVFIENGRVMNLDPADPIRVSYQHPFPDGPITLAELRKRRAARADKSSRADGEPELRMDSLEGHDGTIVNGIGRMGFMTGGKSAIWDDHALSDTFNAKALEFIRKNKSKPFFLYYAAHEPHVPRDPNPRFVGKSGVGARGDAILQLDDQVARIMATLKQEGVDENTLVILSSDNGSAVVDGYSDGAFAAEAKAGHHANGIYRAGKYLEFEGGQRLPFLARWPGHIKPGVSAEPVSLIDLPATVAALTGRQLAPADAPDSLDLLPVLTAGAKSPHAALFYGNASAVGVREGKWKLVVTSQRDSALRRNPPHDGDAPKGPPYLFDLEADPKECVNLADQHPDIVERLKASLTKAANDGFTRPGAAKADHR